MANKTYSEKLKDPRWQKKRLEILNRDEWTCRLCGDKETMLHVHHKKYKGQPWEVENEHLETVCLHCHMVLTEYQCSELPIVKAVKKRMSDGSFILFVRHNCNIEQKIPFIAIYEIVLGLGKAELKTLVRGDELELLQAMLKD